MINRPASHNPADEAGRPNVGVPLLCWDVAHPLLKKHQELANDLETFARLKDRFDWQIETDLRPILADNLTIIVTDRAVRIMWVSDGFYNLTGYQSNEALGKSPAFLQGPLTNKRATETVRRKLSCAQPVAVKMINYRKEGTPYWCQIDIQPLINSQNECTHFIAFEKEF